MEGFLGNLLRMGMGVHRPRTICEYYKWYYEMGSWHGNSNDHLSSFGLSHSFSPSYSEYFCKKLTAIGDNGENTNSDAEMMMLSPSQRW